MVVVVPAEASKDRLIRVHQLVVCLLLTLGRFKPLKRLIVADCEDKVLLDD